jgi:glutamine synthetase adenylyltransferase
MLQRLRQLVADNTSWGFGHRLDFDLRAGGRLGPMTSALDEWVDYFLEKN